MAKKEIVVATSGGFDPLHVGHVRLFQEAKKLGDKLVVIVNSDEWLKRKKGFVFMPLKDRMEVIKAISGVDEVMVWDDGTPNVTGALKKLKPDIFAKGGDRNSLDKVPESRVCEEIGCKIVLNVGKGGKVESSSWLLKRFLDNSKDMKSSIAIKIKQKGKR
ncbi:MAG: adenylyltransferase/cytidyltransferase family protein [Candidatus Doudnabacteria bacterium]|nr:adenylyltransferase/cytidyltransferase family protein [Candidatus Doudnabacteria bacterium]